MSFLYLPLYFLPCNFLKDALGNMEGYIVYFTLLLGGLCTDIVYIMLSIEKIQLSLWKYKINFLHYCSV